MLRRESHPTVSLELWIPSERAPVNNSLFKSREKCTCACKGALARSFRFPCVFLDSGKIGLGRTLYRTEPWEDLNNAKCTRLFLSQFGKLQTKIYTPSNAMAVQKNFCLKFEKRSSTSRKCGPDGIEGGAMQIREKFPV